MPELFRLRIAAKRQVTLPQRMLQALSLKEGDEVRIEVANGNIVHAETGKMMPARLFTPEVLADLAERERQMIANPQPRLDLEMLDRLRKHESVQGAGHARVQRKKLDRPIVPKAVMKYEGKRKSLVVS